MASNDGVLADGRVNSRIENYTQFWQKDMSKEASIDTENRLENYKDVINGA
jgi:sterol 24-C-methyltransferase